MVEVRTRTVVRVLLVVVAVLLALEVIWISRHVLTWIVISIFLALALDPLVKVIQRRARATAGACDRTCVPASSRS